MRIASLATAVILAFSANVYASYMDSIRARCEAYGSTPGTRDFYQCLHDVSAQEQRIHQQNATEPGVAGCRAAQSGTLLAKGADDAAWDARVLLPQLSQVSLTGCSAQLQ